MIGWFIIKLILLPLLSVFFYNLYIKYFKKLAQTERKEGLPSHRIKNGTITMGGIVFLILPLFFISYTPTTFWIVFTTLCFASLGMADDLLIIVLKKNNGLSANFKLLVEIVISGILFYVYLKNDFLTTLKIGNFDLDLKWLFGLLILWMLTASSNAWNLTDGVDGLCSGCSLILGIGLMIVAYRQQAFDIFYLLLCVQIVLFVFWCFNFPKAFLFMGDVGSLALGVFYASCSIFLNSVLAFVLMAGLFIFETLSVILQVAYFKHTKGKRLFKMAPFHHHLEACGWNEWKVNFFFYAVQILLVWSVLHLPI